MRKSQRLQTAHKLFQKAGGVLRTTDAIHKGIHPEVLYQMRDLGIIEAIIPGFFKLTNEPGPDHLEWLIVTQKSSRAVICLLSALVFHDITDQVPADTYIMLPKGIKPPKPDYPTVRSFHLARPSYEAGIQTHSISGIPVRIYGPEKSVVDCFQFRNKVGLEVALEALKLCIQKYNRRPVHFLEFARLCGMENIMLPYLEALS